MSPYLPDLRPVSLLAGCVWATVIAAATSARADEQVAFERDIAPILLGRCLECHNEQEQSGGLDLTRQAALARGGESGSPVVAGDPESSLLLQRVVAGEMPPERQGRAQKLPDAEIALLERWIRAGAEWPAERVLDRFERTTATRGGRDWWSLQPVVRPELPKLRSEGLLAENPVDLFVRARLEELGWEPAPPADKRTLVRRLYLDVIGLPPSAEETEAFLRDESPAAYEQLVDRLLDSPHYGERWARYWLDLVRFAETSGYERDQEKPGAWRYRDWVVDSLNRDKPYDRFVLEQVAGDELPDRTEESVIGTGFLRLGTWNDEPNDPEEYKWERLEDLVHATSSAFLGLTVKCARCHEHKFDPIAQVDYYRMAAAFWAGPIEARGRDLLGGPSREELGYDVLGWTDIAREPAPLHLLKKGDHHRPQQVVEAGALSLLPALDHLFQPPATDAKTSQRRLQLARWIVDPRNPLTTRVFVNRLWQQHFGQGLVRSPNNFGFTGEKPTHPELLDWLSDDFVRGGWRIKRMHKLLLLSQTYRQVSVHPRQEEYSQRDFDNRFWWRAERRRMDAEALRDAMLTVSGQIDLRLGGKSFRPSIAAEALEGLSRKAGAWQASPPEEQRRRSLYVYSQRSLLPPLLTTFDLCDTTQPCGQRDISTVAPQALALLNNAFVHEQSEHLAHRVLSATPEGREQQVRTAWRLALGRGPSASELAACQTHLERQAVRFREFVAREQATPTAAPPREGLVLHLAADQGVEVDEHGRVTAWTDASGGGHHAAQTEKASRPELLVDGGNGRPAVFFDGARRFLHVSGQVLAGQEFSIFVVVSDAGGPGHRAVFSNWSGRDGNSVTSVFLGLTGENTVRLSDDFPAAGQVQQSAQPFLLAAIAGSQDAAVYQNDQLLARKGGPLSARTVTTPNVIGQQGNIDGEYWQGNIAELLVFDRALDEPERVQVSSYLAARHGLPWPRRVLDADHLALASLCHVLLNSNEFVYID